MVPLAELILLEADVGNYSRGPAVENGKMLYTSASAIQLVRSCEAKWAFKYVQRLPDTPPSAAQLRGTKMDEEGKQYFSTGSAVGVGSLFSLAIERGLLPRPGKGIFPNYGDKDATVALKAQGVPVVWEADLVDIHTNRIIDFKTSSDPEKYGAKPGELVNPDAKFGVQMLTYGEGYRLNRGLAPHQPVTLEHLTFRTRGSPDVFVQAEHTTAGEIAERFKGVAENVTRMRELAAGAVPATNVGYCYAYGKPCAYLDRCQNPALRLLNVLTSDPKEQFMGLFKKPEVDVAAPPADLAALRRLNVLTSDPKEQFTGLFKKPEVDVAAPPAVGVVPPEAPLPTVEKKVMEVAPERPRHGLNPEASLGIAQVCFCSASFLRKEAFEAHLAAIRAGAVLLAGEEALGGIKRRGRPPGKKNLPKEAEVIPATQSREAVPVRFPPAAATAAASESAPPAPPISPPPPSVTPMALTPDAASSVPAVAAAEGIRLYIGCIPNRLATKSLTPYVEGLQAQILAAEGLPSGIDIRCAGTKTLGFAQWKGVLVSVLKLSALPEAGHYFIPRGDERVEVVADALEARLPDGSVVRGVA